MAAKFTAYVDQNSDGKWFIELSDELDNKSEICSDLKNFQTKLEDMGAKYGNDIEVQWVKSKQLSLANYRDLEMKMAELHKEYESEIGEIEKQSSNDQSGFNPNA